MVRSSCIECSADRYERPESLGELQNQVLEFVPGGDVVQEGGREDGESSAKEQGGKGQQAMYVKNLPM